MSLNSAAPDYFSPRRCLRDPPAEVVLACSLLSEAADFHVLGNSANAERLLRDADIKTLTAWTDSLWGSRKNHPEQVHFQRYRVVEGSPAYLPKSARVAVRMPTSAEKSQVIERWGRHCVFCGIPLIRPEVRRAFAKWYPTAVSWGTETYGQHAAFQCMWMQFDHVIPHSRGGDNSLENIVVTCAGCNFGRMSWTLDELGLVDPRLETRRPSNWDGLERVFAKPLG
ncbi:HNH endonuclease [Brevundimonas staleyi]|uniref:HNH endonuclease n=1 Tax=Brevundimonas staleyi TaxID=74326 RepID=A0ABW0FVU1_9CAUL